MNKAEQANYKNQIGLSLGDRMKEFENVTRNYLMMKQPVIIRLDGKAFHSYCKQKWVKGPFDNVIISAFQSSTLQLCNSIQGVEFAYHQSDEVTFFLKDYKSQKQQQHFNGNIQKIVSTIASEFTYWFNKSISQYLSEFGYDLTKLRPAFFDCRVYNIPLHEVTNNFIWRQRDAIKNSITSYALNYFSHKELLGKSGEEKQKMLLEKDTDWNKIALHYQRGSGFYKIDIEIPTSDLSDSEIKHLAEKGIEIPEYTIRSKWIVDTQLPIFSEQKNIIENLVTEPLNTEI